MSALLVSVPSPLQALEEAFRLISTGPGQPCLDAREVEGLTAPRLTPAELADLLQQASRPVRDELWRALVRHARSDGATWVVVAAGLALPGLRAIVRRRAQRPGVNRDDLSADVLVAFLVSLKQLDLAAPHVCQRLCYAADKAARRHLYRNQRDQRRLALQGEEPVGPPGPRHPDLVLARAVSSGVLAPGESELIARSRLERRSLHSAAAELGWSYATAKRRRRHAEARLAVWLTEETTRAC